MCQCKIRLGIVTEVLQKSYLVLSLVWQFFFFLMWDGEKEQIGTVYWYKMQAPKPLQYIFIYNEGN